jgi:hypothetical protein
MNADEDITVSTILAQAKLAALPLTEEEAAQLLTGVRRNRLMAQAVRRLLVDPVTEPAPVFALSPDAGGN